MDYRSINAKAIGKQVIALVLAVHLLNFSINPRDPISPGSSGDRSLNEIETIMELVLEDFFKVGNVIGDTDEADHEEESVNAPLTVLFCNRLSDLTSPFVPCVSEKYPARNSVGLYSSHDEVAGPPPRDRHHHS